MNKKGNQKQRFLVSLARILGTGALICTILLLIPLAVPQILGYETYNVVSGSMEPEIPVDSLILVKPVDPSTLEEGDIIAFYDENSIVCHRVVANNNFEQKL